MSFYKKTKLVKVQLKKRREALGISKQQLSQLANVNYIQIQNYEKNNFPMLEETWKKIEKVLKQYEQKKRSHNVTKKNS